MTGVNWLRDAAACDADDCPMAEHCARYQAHERIERLKRDGPQAYVKPSEKPCREFVDYYEGW